MWVGAREGGVKAQSTEQNLLVASELEFQDED
jgi:hypothetical protein